MFENVHAELAIALFLFHFFLCAFDTWW